MPKGLETAEQKAYAKEVFSELVAKSGNQALAGEAIGVSQGLVSRAVEEGTPTEGNLFRAAMKVGRSLQEFARIMGITIAEASLHQVDEKRVVAEYLRAQLRQRLRAGATISELASSFALDEGALRKIYGGQGLSVDMVRRLTKAFGFETLERMQGRADEWWEKHGKALLAALDGTLNPPPLLNERAMDARGHGLSEAEILSLLESLPADVISDETKWTEAVYGVKRDRQRDRHEQWTKDREKAERLLVADGVREKPIVRSSNDPPAAKAPSSVRGKRTRRKTA